MNFTVNILLVICTNDFSWIVQLKSSIIPVLLSCSSFIAYTDSHDSYIQSRNKVTRTMLKPQYNSTVVYQQMDSDKVLTFIAIQINAMIHLRGYNNYCPVCTYRYSHSISYM